MPRIGRVVAQGCPHHVTQRGNYGQSIFSGENDFKKYLQWLEDYSKKYELVIVGYCLMPNHVHLVVVPHNADSIAKTLNLCHMLYSQYYNKKSGKIGHLWQGRFYSCALEERHLYEALRYVENNPVRAKLVPQAQMWKYSSARAHMSGMDNSEGLQLGKIPMVDAIEDWSKYLEEKEEQNTIKEIRANTLTGRPSGSAEFVARLEQKFGKKLKPLPGGRPRKHGSCP